MCFVSLLSLIHIFLGWERAVGLRQASGEGAVPLAGVCERSGQGGTQPVSYTHLDVYKRQVIDSRRSQLTM